jgi:hypothetical protein
MKERKGMFKGLSIESFWLPFTAILIDSSNTAMKMTGGEDAAYCKFMALTHDLLLPLYVDSKVIDLSTYNRMFRVFIFVFEFIYGDPYYQGHVNKEFKGVEEFFNDIKRNWNTDIKKILEKTGYDI